MIEQHVAALLDDYNYIAAGGGNFVEGCGSPLPGLLFADWFKLSAAQTELLWRNRASVREGMGGV